MERKIALIDGYSLLFRAFHALPLMDNGEGEYTNAVYGFMSMLLKVLQTEQPDALAVAAVIWPEYVLETTPCYGVACVGEDAAYGQVILYREGFVYEATPDMGSFNIEVVSKIDAQLYKENFMAVMTGKE